MTAMSTASTAANAMAIFFNMGRSSGGSVYEVNADGKRNAVAQRAVGIRAPLALRCAPMVDLTIHIRRASERDIAAILRLYSGDGLHGANVATKPAESHSRALAAIEAEPNNGVYVALLGERVVGTFQLTFIPQLSFGGCLVAQVES